MLLQGSPILLLMLACSCQPSLQDPIFQLPASAMSPFKGLPGLPGLNETADETRSVYYHDQVVAVVDVAGGKRLLRCELVEV